MIAMQQQEIQDRVEYYSRELGKVGFYGIADCYRIHNYIRAFVDRMDADGNM